MIDAGIDILCCFGAATRPLRDAFADRIGRADAADRAIWTETIEGIDGRLRAIVRDGDLVLLKASRAFRIERLLPALDVGTSDPTGRCDG